MLSETSKVILTIIEKQLENGDNKGLKEYGVLIDNADDQNYHWNVEAMQEMADALKYQQKEIEFLKQRNSDLRKKTYIKVYDENLMLIEEHKTLVKTIDQMRSELIQLGQLADKFHLESNNLKNENEKLKGVLKSVETFIGQYVIR